MGKADMEPVAVAQAQLGVGAEGGIHQGPDSLCNICVGNGHLRSFDAATALTVHGCYWPPLRPTVRCGRRGRPGKKLSTEAFVRAKKMANGL